MPLPAPSDNELALLAVRVGAALLERQWKVATAESCTGGYVAKLLTDVPGSSQWFECGYVTYSNASKQHSLGVTAGTLQEFGAVSDRTVVEMAAGALENAGAHRSVAISGVAGPDGGTPAHPVGDVWFARAQRRAGGGADVVTLHRRFPGGRDDVRRQASAFALELLIED